MFIAWKSTNLLRLGERLVRDCNGLTLGVFAGKCGYGNRVQAAIFAVHFGLHLLQTMDASGSIVKSDSHTLVNHMGI